MKILLPFDVFLRTWCQRIISLPDTAQEVCRVSHKDAPLARLYIFLWALSCVVYARALFFPVLGIDTLTYALSEGYGDVYFEIMRGIWGFSALNHVVPGPLVAPFVSMLFFIIITNTAVFLITIFWLGNKPDWKTYLIGSLMALFPYWASQAYFSYYHYGYALATLTAVLSVLIPWHKGGWLRCALAAFLFMCGASMYQGSVNIASGLMGTSMLVGMVYYFLHKPYVRYTICSLSRVCMSLFAGSLLYLLLHKCIVWYLQLPVQNKGYAVHWSVSFQRVWQEVGLLFPGSKLLLPTPAAWILCIPLLLLIVELFRKQNRIMYAYKHGMQTPQAWRNMLLCFVPFACIAAFSPFALSFVQGIKLASRSTSSVAFVWASVFLLVTIISGDRWKKTLLFVATVLCILFASRVNYAWQLQSLTTEADLNDARLMRQQIYDLPEFATMPKPVTIAFVGCISEDSRSWPQDYEAIFGLSQFACFGEGNLPAHAGAALRFVGAHIKAMHPMAHDYTAVANRKPWPAQESIFWNKDHVVLWLGPLQRKKSNISQNIHHIAIALGVFEGEDDYKERLATMYQPLLQLVVAQKGPWSGEGTQRVAGSVDVKMSFPQNTAYTYVQGWAYDTNTKLIPPFIALLNCTGQVVGVGATGVYRQDLLRKIAVDAEYAGFEGFAIAQEEICAIAYK